MPMLRPSTATASSRITPLVTSIVVLAALYFARAVFIPFALAGLFAFLLTPLVRRLEIWRLGRIPAVVLVLILTFTVTGGLGWIATNQLIQVLEEMPRFKENIHHKFMALEGSSGGGLAKARASVQELTQELTGAQPSVVSPSLSHPGRGGTAQPVRPVPVEVVQSPSNALQAISGLLGPLVVPIGTAVIVIVLAVVMLLKREDLRNRLLRLIGQTQLNVATTAFDDATQRVSRYLRLQFLVNAVFGALVTVGLACIGIPYALVWGILAGVFRFVPYVGPLLGLSMPFILAFAAFGGWLQPLLCLALFLVLEPIVAYVIEPALYGRHTGISSLAILLAAVFWTTLWGPIGLILSTPLTVCLAVIGRYTPQLDFLHILLGDEPVLSFAEQVYQRLLALDQQEARALIEAYLKDHPIIELYDDVLIPALGMAEEDRHKGALEESREQFLLQSLEEFIVELGESQARVAAGKREQCVICIPAADHADEITASMLAQVLEIAGCSALVIPLSKSPLDVVETLLRDADYTVCIAALPPFALLQSRSLRKALLTRFPDLRVVLGVWSFSGGVERADERLEKAFGADVATRLAQAVERIQAPAAAIELENDADTAPLVISS